MKKFLPFIFVSLLLFVTMKAIHHINTKESLKKEFRKCASDSLQSSVLPKENLFFEKFQNKVVPPAVVSLLPRLQPSDFKAHCYYNCKLLSSSKNGLCFFPGGLSLTPHSKPLFCKGFSGQLHQYS